MGSSSYDWMGELSEEQKTSKVLSVTLSGRSQPDRRVGTYCPVTGRPLWLVGTHSDDIEFTY